MFLPTQPPVQSSSVLQYPDQGRGLATPVAATKYSPPPAPLVAPVWLPQRSKSKDKSKVGQEALTSGSDTERENRGFVRLPVFSVRPPVDIATAHQSWRWFAGDSRSAKTQERGTYYGFFLHGRLTDFPSSPRCRWPGGLRGKRQSRSSGPRSYKHQPVICSPLSLKLCYLRHT